jgi:hypothetical protein
METARLRDLARVKEPRKTDIFNVQLRAVRHMLIPRGKPSTPASIDSGPSELSLLAHETLKRLETLLTSSSHAENHAQDKADDGWELWPDCTSDGGAPIPSDDSSDDEGFEPPPSTKCRVCDLPPPATFMYTDCTPSRSSAARTRDLLRLLETLDLVTGTSTTTNARWALPIASTVYLSRPFRMIVSWIRLVIHAARH